MRYERIIVFILDGCGVGCQEDYLSYQKEPTNTIGSIYRSIEDFALPFMEMLGLGKLLDVGGSCRSDLMCYGKMRQVTAGNDTFAGVWEMLGVPFNIRFNGNSSLDSSTLHRIYEETGISVIGNEYISGYLALDKYFHLHSESRQPILYLSDDGVILLAGHTDVLPAAELNGMAKEIARLLFDRGYARIITRPFYGTPGHFIRLESLRKDFLLLEVPSTNLISHLVRSGVRIRTTPHLARLLNDPENVSVLAERYSNNQQLMKLVEDDTKRDFDVQLYLFPDTDNLGHRKDVIGFGEALVVLDNWLRGYVNMLKPNDLLIITADHGTDPTSSARGHTREYVPLLIHSERLAFHGDLGIRRSFSDLGQTIAKNFGLCNWNFGESLEVV